MRRALSDENIAVIPLTPEEENIVNRLRAKGCSNQEITLMLTINREVYSGGIGRIMFDGWHYWYIDGNGKPYDGSTCQNCGLFATVRLLHHLGQGWYYR
jgi:hypothetical protein